MSPLNRVRPLLTASAMLAASMAHAQSNVDISGSLDVGAFRDTTGAWNVGTIGRSYLQFSGKEDLGDGLSVTFKLQTRFDLDTGATEGNGSKPFWHGESTVGMRGGFGAVRLGRALDAIQSQDWAFDAWGNWNRIASPAWDLWHWNYSADPRGGGSGRVANAVFYDSPTFANTTLRISYSPESVAGDAAKTRAFSLVYNNNTIRALIGSGKNSAGATQNVCRAPRQARRAHTDGQVQRQQVGRRLQGQGDHTGRHLLPGAGHTEGRLGPGRCRRQPEGVSQLGAWR